MIVSLRFKILSIVLIFLSLIGAAFVYYSFTTTNNYKNMRIENMKGLVAYEAEKINKLISAIEGGAVFFALSGKLTYEAGLEKLGETLCLEYLKGFPIAIGGGFWYEPYAFNKDVRRCGFYAFFDKTLMEARMDDTFIINEYDYHSISWYRDIIDNISAPYQVVWTKPYIDDTGSYTLMTTAGSGVYNESGELIAISTIDWEIEEVIKHLTELSPTKNSFVLLCVPQFDYIISGFNEHIQDFSLKNLPWDIYADSFNLNNKKYISFNHYMDNGWYLSIQIPEKEIFEDVERRNNRYLMIIILTSAFMLLSAFLIISKFINEPVRKLTDEVSRIALGNLDFLINVSSKDEIGLLAQTFNKMTGELKKSIEENAREREEKKRINTELGVAHEIQTSMLPSVFPAFPDRMEFDLHALMVPARDIGGDFYDFFFIDNDNLAVVIADVSGKGVPAALYMVVAKTLIKNSCINKDPNEVFELVNKKLCDGNDASMFVTAFMGFLNIPSGRFTYVNAGHNPPLFKKYKESYKFIKNDPCIFLGFMEDAQYKQEELILKQGDVLYLYTDGITEAMNINRELYSEERLLQTLNKFDSYSPKDIIFAVKEDVDNFAGSVQQADDITMLALVINNTKEIRVKANLDNLDKVIEFINEPLINCGFSSVSINEIEIAVEEIFTNIIKYAYENKEGHAQIAISTTEKVKIRFKDDGKPYNPMKHCDPDLDTDILDREIGGLGILIIKKIMDSVDYSRKNNKNILTITKAIPKK